MPRPVSCTIEDISILVEALKYNERWRFEVVCKRVAADLAPPGQTARIALASDPEAMIDLFRRLVENKCTN